jgi:tRNA threonylcarbamoyladenosine biosynthesis protein TsaB
MKQMIIDTSSKILYVAFFEDDREIFSVASEGSNNHSENLINTIKAGLEKCGLAVRDFDRIVVGIGPGSYTGLRVGLTVAKVFAWTLKIPLHCVSSLDVLASGYLNTDGIYAITAQAKRNSVYAKLIQVQDKEQRVLIPDGFWDSESFRKEIEEYNYSLIDQSNYRFNPLNLRSVEVEDLHQLTPNYLQKEV